MTYSMMVSIPGIRLPLLHVEPGPWKDTVSLSIKRWGLINGGDPYGNSEVVRKPGRRNTKVHIAPLTPIIGQCRLPVEYLEW